MNHSKVCNYGCFSDMNADQAERKPRVHVLTLICSLMIPILVGCFSTLLTMDDMNVYGTLVRPPLAPPGWLFPIIWGVMYVLMGLAAYFALTGFSGPLRKWIAMSFYYTQLMMNFFWPILFFTYSRYTLSLAWLIVMWWMTFVCMFKFYRIRKIAGVFMGIILAWTTYAIYLNFAYVLYTR